MGISNFDDILLAHQLLPRKIAIDVSYKDVGTFGIQINGKVFRNEVGSVTC